MDNNYWNSNNFNPYTDYQKIAKDYIDSLDLTPIIFTHIKIKNRKIILVLFFYRRFNKSMMD